MKPLTFGNYEALFHIASGGMAEVFAARIGSTSGRERLVAVKRLLPDLTDERFKTMFMDEAQIASQVRSPHVVRTFELGTDDDDGALFIVMELIVGVTLFELCVSSVEDHHRPMPEQVIAEIIAQAAQGMSDAHEATGKNGEPLQIIHRDLSPQNLLCGVDGRVRVTDFGIARARSRMTETRAGQLKGKVAYVSPEQARGKRIDARSDVFSLGIVAWEGLTGKSLFNTGKPNETLKRVLNMSIPDPRQLRPDVSPEVAKAVLWALERDVERRCPSMARFERALREASPRVSKERLSGFITRFGGPSLDRIQQALHKSRQPQRIAFSRPVDSGTTRLVPSAPVSSTRLLGAPTGVGSPERGVETEVLHDRKTAPSARGERAAPRPKRYGALAVGLLAWILAAVVVYLAMDRGPRREETSPLRFEAER
ncbi:MAG: serine/threonine-protein kinase [Myxococcota bacterium]